MNDNIKVIWRCYYKQYNDNKSIILEFHLPAENGKLTPLIAENENAKFWLGQPLSENWGRYCEELNTRYVRTEIKFPQTVTWLTITNDELPEIIWAYKHELQNQLFPDQHQIKNLTYGEFTLLLSSQKGDD